MSFVSDCRGQVSAELLIVIAAVLAVAVILVTQLQSTAQKGSDAVSTQVDKALEKIG
ncbi:MAG: class III signal peptide-containing protein [Candidatus Micrarchaeota archaeon]